MSHDSWDEHPQSDVLAALDVEHIRYAQVWEDSRLLEQALAIQPDDHILSIGSAGCIVLAMLRHEPRAITAIDVSRAQIALMELKFAGIQHLDYDAFVSLLGLSSAYEPLAVYRQLEPGLSPTCRAYWQAHQDVLTAGVVHAGKLEQFFLDMQRDHLPPAWSAEAIQTLLSAPSLAAQQERFARLKTQNLERMFLDYFSESSFAKNQTRDPAQFRYVTHMSLGHLFLERFSNACTQLPLPGNHYVEYFLTGTYRDLEQGPTFLRKADFEALKPLIDRIRIVYGALESYLPSVPSDHFTKANLSDIFEYMSIEASDHLFAALADKIRPRGRMAYWNVFVPRQSPNALQHVWRHLDEVSDRLWRQDRAWFYGAFHVEERQA